MHVWCGPVPVSISCVNACCGNARLCTPAVQPGLACFCRVYSDIIGVKLYVADSAQAAYARNMSIYLSSTVLHRNQGVVCVANMTMATGTAGNGVQCSQSISNALYVTIERPLYTGSDYLYFTELQILRNGGQPGNSRVASLH